MTEITITDLAEDPTGKYSIEVEAMGRTLLEAHTSPSMLPSLDDDEAIDLFEAAIDLLDENDTEDSHE